MIQDRIDLQNMQIANELEEIQKQAEKRVNLSETDKAYV